MDRWAARSFGQLAVAVEAVVVAVAATAVLMLASRFLLTDKAPPVGTDLPRQPALLRALIVDLSQWRTDRAAERDRGLTIPPGRYFAEPTL